MLPGKTYFILLFVIGFLFCNPAKQAGHDKKSKELKPDLPAVQQMPVWTGSIPGAELITGTETYKNGMLTNVSNPTITLYTPAQKNSGAAVLVFPGGGYKNLAVDHEGAAICEWLASIGVTGILLKYRVPDSGPHYEASCQCEIDPVKPLALQDAQRAMGLVRYRAKEWNIDPNKIGVIGFSAGGHLAADISTNYKKRLYPLMDDADTVSCRPDFGIVVYPGHLLIHTNGAYELNRKIPVDRYTPPTFIVQAGDDPVDTIQNSLVYYIALKKAGVPVEYHIYAEGGHGFGLRNSHQPGKLPVAGWPALAETWLHTIHMIPD